MTDSDTFTILEEVLVNLRLRVLLGDMLDITLAAMLLDVIHRHVFDKLDFNFFIRIDQDVLVLRMVGLRL